MRNARNLLWVAAVLVVGVAIGAYLADSANSVIPAALAAGGEVDSPSRNLARYVDRIADYVPNLDMMVVYRLDRPL